MAISASEQDRRLSQDRSQRRFDVRFQNIVAGGQDRSRVYRFARHNRAWLRQCTEKRTPCERCTNILVSPSTTVGPAASVCTRTLDLGFEGLLGYGVTNTILLAPNEHLPASQSVPWSGVDVQGRLDIEEGQGLPSHFDLCEGSGEFRRPIAYFITLVTRFNSVSCRTKPKPRLS